jgi:NAD-reducing hydrogenase small subunit
MTETVAKVDEQSGRGAEAGFPAPSQAASSRSVPKRTQDASSTAGETPAATSGRLRLATVWLGGCSGCHMSFLDLDEDLIEIAGKIDLVYSPVIDVKEYPVDVDVCLVEGAVCNEDNLHLLRKIRRQTKVLVAFGDCAVTGNVPAIRNQLGLRNDESVLQRAYVEGAQSNPSVPRDPEIVPALLPRVQPVHEIVHVDYFLNGCPPAASRIKTVLSRVLAGKEPKLEGAELKFG